jgi:MtN3 and saliva related transmembrane protein
MQIDTNLLGFLAATLTTISFVPQVILVWRKRSAQGISAGMYALFTVGVGLWLCYGLLIGSLPVIIANGITLVLAASVLLMKWHFEREQP